MKYPISNINPDKERQKYLNVALPSVIVLKFWSKIFMPQSLCPSVAWYFDDWKKQI